MKQSKQTSKSLRIISILAIGTLLAFHSPAVGAEPAPTIDSFDPTSGCAGTEVKIKGSGLNDVNSVRFNAVSATFERKNSTEVVAIVPSGASTGPITITTPEGTATSSSNFTVTTVGCPAIASFSPTSGPPGTSVVITGSGFAGTTAVRFNGKPAQFTVNSDAQVTAIVPQDATTGPISIDTPNGAATSASSFSVSASAAPTIGSLSPEAGCQGTRVTITGTNLSGATMVRFNGVSATFTVESNSRLSAYVPSTATSGPVTVSTPNGTATSPVSFTVPVGCPSIANFTPTSGSSGSTVVITGTNFLGTSAVRFNGVTATYVVNSPTQITAVVPGNASTGRISVTNPSGTATSETDFFVSGSSAPSITTLDPTSGCPGTRVAIWGANLSGASSVRFNGISAQFTVESPSRITATVPTGASTGPVTVVTPSGVATSPSSFVVPTGCPTIANFAPSSGPGGTTVVISGTNFLGTIAVKFNGVSATYFVTAPTQITAIVPADATSGRITVTNGVGTGTSLSDFNVTFSTVPTVTSFNPITGPAGTAVVIFGTNFESTTTVRFNGVPTTSFTVDSPTRVTAVVPPGATTGPISVITATGTATSADDFTVTPAGSPTITSFSPTSGPSGTKVSITGTNFNGAASVAFNGSNANFVVNSNGQITATVPASATTGRIRVTNGSGSATSASDFTVTPTGSPTIASFSPTSGPIGTEVVITGSNLQDTSKVAFDGTTASYVVNSSTQITSVVPSGATTGRIAVVTPAGTATSAQDFTVTQPLVVHARSVTLLLRRHLVAKGAVSAAQVGCLIDVGVRIQKRRSGAWRTIARTTTDQTGNYRVRLANRSGRYRARAPRFALNQSELCAAATSPADVPTLAI